MASLNDIRRTFLDYYGRNGHAVVDSSPLVPRNDPTLMFTNAGMVQFKNVFTGNEQRPYKRAVTSQKCVRAGGKHNDLDNVGHTARHHTFFEMLGNFSFGDYFKRDAIRFAWELLVEVLKMPPERLWVTVFEEDDEAADIWLKEIGVDPERFSRIGAKDNFWAMGDTGPCGPCSEIFYDHGAEVPGGPPGTPEEDGDRYIEIWNLVFMQFNRSADGSMTPLPRPSVDTGMGLERLVAVLQGVHSNYEIDLFENLLRAAAQATDVPFDPDNSSLKVIADHIRSVAFLITDGVLPGNEGRGYVLRRIMRRAIRHGFKLGCETPFFHRLVQPLVEEMGEAYPELSEAAGQVSRVILQEEERFAETLSHGMQLLERDIADLSGTVISGDTAFRLYDTYGFPVDLTADIARERGLEVDMAGFERAMEGQRQRARAASQFGAQQDLEVGSRTEFCGYEQLSAPGTIVGLYQNNQPVEAIVGDTEAVVVLDTTPFYAEAGGQVGDTGVLSVDGGEFRVEGTRKQGEGAFLHSGRLIQGKLRKGDRVEARVDTTTRRATALNHSATHLLHAALREVLGAHVQQKGSLVAPDRLRFDFSHFEPISAAQLSEIERIVNREIRHNLTVEATVMPLEQARAAGAMALFGEKYGNEVRVLKMGDFSLELCGGTHVQHTGDIGYFKIINEGGVAAGVRRIEAITGDTAVAHAEALDNRLGELAELLKGDRDGVPAKVQQLLERNRQLEKELEHLKAKLASGSGGDLADQAVDVAGTRVVAARLDGVDAKTLRTAVDRLKDKLKTAAVVLATVENGKVRLVAGVTDDRTDRLKAGELVNSVAEQVGGRGGGRADMAQAGGSDPAGLDAALQGVADWVRQQLA